MPSSSRERNDDAEAPAEAAIVLIVDDEVAIAEALADVITDAGYRVLVAEHGEAALTLVREYQPTLIITDLMMPRLNGAGLIRAVRAEALADDHPPPIIILMTAAGSSAIRDIVADAVLVKPFDLDEIDHLLDRFLGQPH